MDTPGDATLVDDIVKYLKAKGIFDEFRQECLADMDTKSSFQNLTQRIDGYTTKFLANETWHPDMNKNELRNKLRRSIEESGILDVGADHVVEQVITSKIRQVFFPRITEVMHQYIKEQNELSSKQYETASSENASSSERAFYDMSDSKTKSSISDPIADILSFSYSKSKPIPTTSIHVKADSIQFKHADLPKLEKIKKEKLIPVTEKSFLEISTKNTTSAIVTETKPVEKEKIKIESEPEVYQEVSKHVLKEEFKCEKKKTEEVKAQSSETITPVEEKKDFDKNKQKLKSSNTQKLCSSSSEIKKPKKEASDDKPSDKVTKIKPVKSLKELSSPIKSISSMKSGLKEEKIGESSKSKSADTSSSKTESPVKKSSKCSSIKKDSSKHKGHSEKPDKSKIPKSSDKNDQNIHYDSPNSEKAAKNIHYSSSHDSSQGSDQEKSSCSSKKEKQKHFSKHAEKEKLEEHSAKSSKTVCDKNILSDADESPKKFSSEKSSKHEQLKDTTVIEIAKLSSCSNSGSTSSVSSSSNASKDNLSNSDEASESSVKEKKKKQVKEKVSCQNPSKTLPSPPPPPPSSGSLLASSAEMSISEDTQSSSDDSEVSNSEGKSEESSNVSESESKDSLFKNLNKSASNSSTYNLNDFYDIFLYSSSSSEFEGFENSPERKNNENAFQDIHSSELSVSSVHTSDLSSYDDELSDENFSFLDESNSTGKRLTLRKAQELMQNKPTVFKKSKTSPIESSQDTDPISFNEKCIDNLSIISCDKEAPPPEPTRSLRRERKLNPRYASSEYTSIFSSKKESFITKRSSPLTKKNSCSSPNVESKCEKKNLLGERKLPKKCLVKSKINAMHQDEVEQFQKTNNLHNLESHDKKDTSCSNEMNSILKKEIFQDNNKCTDNDHLKIKLKLNLQNNSELNKSSYSIKYKLSVADESSPVKRLCNQSSEFIPNENKPFNSEKQSMIEEKILGDDSLKGLGVTVGIKKDPFCKQRANNNGDVLGQKDIFSNNSHGKAISNAEKKTSETGTSKELNAL